MPEPLRKGDVVNLRPEYIKYALGGGSHYGEDIPGSSWVVDHIYTPANTVDRFIFAKPCGEGGQYLEMINGAAVPENYLVKNEFLTSIYKAASESRREE